MSKYGIFPFGSYVIPVIQQDRSPKKVFILGVYASAVHARWIDLEGNSLVNALAVASEPEIFWCGDGADEIISAIKIPEELGILVPAAKNLNGPSGRSLNQEYLEPLGLSRNAVWLSDIYPFTHMNKGQEKAIEREYLPRMEKYKLPPVTFLPAPTKEPGEKRREEIWQEFLASQAEILILLGDRPIEWFLKFLLPDYKKLSDFGMDSDNYGRIHPYKIRNRNIGILPLVHPRQASRLGASSEKWFGVHKIWKSKYAPDLL